MPRREVAARRDDVTYRLGYYLAVNDFHRSIRSHARTLAAPHLGLVRYYSSASTKILIQAALEILLVLDRFGENLDEG
jgi:hypothetical protein